MFFLADPHAERSSLRRRTLRKLVLCPRRAASDDPHAANAPIYLHPWYILDCTSSCTYRVRWLVRVAVRVS
jgi:hypothetical protein